MITLAYTDSEPDGRLAKASGKISEVNQGRTNSMINQDAANE